MANDLNGNGVQDAGEAGLSGRTVFADVDKNGVVSAGDVVATTDAAGHYSLAGLPPHVYPLIVTVPTGCQSSAASASVWVQSGSALVQNWPVRQTPGSISGTVYSDANGNGTRDAGETGLANATVYLDLNNSGTFDAGDPFVITPSSGAFTFSGLAPGNYPLREIPPVNGYATAPSGGSYAVALSAGQAATGDDFGNTLYASVSGRIFEDLNGDGIYGGGDATVAGLQAYLDQNNNGALDPGETVAKSALDGSYSFTHLKPGTYTIRQVLIQGWAQSLPAANAARTVALTGGQSVTAQDFGQTAAASASISGTVFNDANANGVLDSSGDAGVGGRTVYLDANNNGQLDAGEVTAATTSAGAYAFANLAAGTYVVREVLPAGWRQTSPAGGAAQGVTLSTGGAATAINFGATNLPPVAKPGGPYTVAEGGSVTLSGAGSSEAFGSIAKYEWDTNYNGATFNPVLTGAGPTLSAAGLDGPATRTIALRVTDANGLVSAVGTTTLSVTNAPPTATFTGSTVTQGSAGTVTFSGQKDPSPADVAAGFTYSYDFNDDGTFDVVDSTSATVAVPASYLATVGGHTVKGRIKDKDGGYTDYTTTVTVTAPAGTGSIAGTVFNDANGNGVRDSLEGAMANVTLYLDSNKDGKYEAGEPTAVTNSAGAFAFQNLPGGVDYRVREVLPSGYRVSSPAGGYADVALAAGQAASNVTFADTRTVLFAGQVFNDANANGGKDASETGLAGWTVYLDTNKNGVKDAGEPTATTDAAGNYRFVLPAPSVATAYAARLVLPPGWRQTYPSGSAAQSATLSAGGSATGRNFLATQKALVGGTAFADANGDGVRQSTELGLSGWRVFVNANNDGVFESTERSVLTDASGNWSFTTLTAGTYVLRVVPQSGYARTTPTTGTPAGSYAVTVANGQVKGGYLFGERKIA